MVRLIKEKELNFDKMKKKLLASVRMYDNGERDDNREL
jgi:hypothetical protein